MCTQTQENGSKSTLKTYKSLQNGFRRTLDICCFIECHVIYQYKSTDLGPQDTAVHDENSCEMSARGLHFSCNWLQFSVFLK